MKEQMYKLLNFFPNSNLEKLPVKNIQNVIKKRNKKDKHEILKIIDEIIFKKIHINNTKDRIILIKIIIAFLPDTLDIVDNILKYQEHKNDFELQFTLFCYLGQVFQIKLKKEYFDEIENYISEYLLKVKKEVAAAAWMAGDMLGDHWSNKNNSLTILLNVLKNGKYVAGRKGALHGLNHFLDNEHSEKNIKKIYKTLITCLYNEKSKKIKADIIFYFGDINTEN